MNNTEKTLQQDKSCEEQAEKIKTSGVGHGKALMKDRVKRGKGICMRLARDIFSFGRKVSDASSRQANNTSFGLVMMGEKKNKVRRKLRMNNLIEKARRINEAGSKEIR